MTRLLLTMLVVLVLVRGGCTPHVAEAACPKTKRSAAVVRQFKRTHVCPSTGIASASKPCSGFVVDHVAPLCAGGSDTVDNLMYQAVESAKKKDVWERALCRKLCTCQDSQATKMSK
jgi:hypothetical protein